MRIWVVVAALLVSACSQATTEVCPDIYFVGARGSGQEPGIGPQLDDAYDQFVKAVDGIEVESVPLDYPAAESRLGDVSVYADSVEAGAHELPAALASLECSDARVVLAGYSQGAHVIAAADFPADTVDAVILLASPVFSPTDGTEKSGDFNPEQEGLVADRPIDAPLAEKTIQVCLSGDPVCQFGSIAFWVHSNGYYGETLGPAVEFAASRVRN